MSAQEQKAKSLTAEEVKVEWNISADVECPKCKHINDFMDVDEWYLYCQVGESKDVFRHKLDFECDECNHKFIVNGSSY